MRHGISAALCAVLACSSEPPASTPPPGPTIDPGAPARLASELSSPLDPANVDAAVEALARAGIEALDDEALSVLEPVGPGPYQLRFLRYQAASMAAELARRGGRTGLELDALVALEVPEAGEASPSLMIASYAKQGDTFGARLSRELLGPFELDRWRDLRYPNLVILLFVRDALGASGHRTAAEGLSARAQGPCGSLQQAMSGLPQAVASQIASNSSLPGWVSAALGGAAQLATQAAIHAIQGALSGGAASRILGALSTITYVTSLALPWDVELAPMPAASLHYVVEGSVGGLSAARFEGVAESGLRIPYPPGMVACASLAGLTLPQGQSVEGAMVSWTPAFRGHARTTGTPTAVLAADGRVEHAVETSSEPSAVHLGGRLRTESIELEVEVTPVVDPDKLEDAIASMLGIPSWLSGLAAGFVSAIVGDVQSVRASAATTVERHVAPASFVHVEDGVTVDAYNCDGVEGAWTVQVTVSGDASGSGPGAMSLDASGVGTLSWDVPVSIPEVGAGSYSASLALTVTSTAANPVVHGSGMAIVRAAGQANAAPYDVTIPLSIGPLARCP